MSTINAVAPGSPVITVTMPDVIDDVWGIEIRASDNVTVLYSDTLSDAGLAPVIGVSNTTTSLSYYVYTFNLLGEYSAGYNLTATAPVPTYTVSYSPTVAGVAFVVTPVGDLSANHYEAYWNFTGATPAADQIPNWGGDVNGAGTFHFFVGEAPGAVASVWVRAVGDSTLAQGWTAFTAQTVEFIDPSTGVVLAKGSVPPALNEAFSYSNTASAITWSWTGMAIYRADGTITNPANNSRSTTGLSASSTYYFYPYFDESLAVIAWVNGSGNGSTGEAFTSAQRTNTVAQTQGLQSRVPLSNGPMSAATTSGGTGGGGSGGGGGSCVRSSMLVHERTKGIIPAREVHVGDWLLTTNAVWTQVVYAEERPQDLFIRVRVQGQYVQVTPTHPFNAMDENCNAIENLPAGKLSCMHQLYTRDGADFVEAVELIHARDGKKMVITCDAVHTFLAGETEPFVETHNLMMFC